MSITTTSPFSCATTVPARGVATISTSSGAELDARQAHAAGRQVLDLVVACRGQHLLGGRAQARADARQQRLAAALDQR